MFYILEHKVNVAFNVHTFPSNNETDDEPRWNETKTKYFPYI